MPNAFVSYRRLDAAQAALGLNAQLRTRFGPSSVFLDASSILPGSLWPDRLRDSLVKADVLLAVIGPRWLTAANSFGQRRLDDKDDWVRREIAYALENGKPLFPLLVAGATELPPPKALPGKIRALLKHQALKLRDHEWDRDLSEVVELLKSKYGFVDNQIAVKLPQPEKKQTAALTASELENELSSLLD